MGSRAVVVVCRDEDAARRRFGVVDEELGICLHAHRAAASSTTPRSRQRSSTRVRAAVDAAGLWDELETDWLLLDCELMPWSAKAQELLREQYAAVGAAARAGARRDGRGARAGVGARRERRRPARSDFRRAARRRRALRRRLPPLLLAGRRASTTSSSRRSTCSRREGAVHIDKDASLAHGARSRGSCAEDDELLRRDGAPRVVDTTDPRASSGRRRGGRS